MNPEELNQFRENKKDFLHWFGKEVLSLEDTAQSLNAQFKRVLQTIQNMEGKNFHQKEDFSIPILILLVDRLIAQCDCIKNQLIELKWQMKLHRSHIYRSHNKE